MAETNYLKIFKALADENRLQLLQKIAAADEVCVCKLIDETEMAQSKLSYHLKLLLDAGLIKVTPQGKWNFYAVNCTALQAVFTDKAVAELLK